MGFNPDEARDDHGRWTGGGSAPANTGNHAVGVPHAYNAQAVNNAIASSNHAGRHIGGKEAKAIHALLKRRTNAPKSGVLFNVNPKTGITADQRALASKIMFGK